ncbi:hypothetical protein P344_02145 [Spiroplasma mirum ATCC 29335]|uniref:Cytidylate kinase n=1 Tax=Spiroplasma mirum ATCC 29335 TaxID=838561 RepID=W0GKV8_9MOLU|nr:MULTISPECIES: (d)CMP kinase [Spiroplasma]AHF60812.1 cytidylate kinase [Spiroplasma mirum ATCC 29335]AHI57777.1 hypothetical protein P344_02145 [Spiroplasma mirum ATCC 29335]AKM52922.1 cytidylate kinase [Spiroplasma atrichopogonis]
MKINIAIDGPAGSGKSSAGAELAKQIGYQFIDTGLTYRAFTYYCVVNNVDFNDYQALQAAIKNFNFQVVGDDIFVNNENVTDQLQQEIVLKSINKITGLAFIREAMVELQRSLAKDHGVVMVGRDITSVVLPTAELKFFLTASIEVRALRRWNQNKVNNIVPNDLELLKEQLTKRDQADMQRATGPLVVTSDAIVLNNSNLTFAETIQALLKLYNEKIKSEEQ